MRTLIHDALLLSGPLFYWTLTLITLVAIVWEIVQEVA